MSDAQNWVAMGYVKGALGVRGWVRVQPSTEYTDSLLDYQQWRLIKGKKMQNVELLSGHVSGSELQVHFDGVNDRDMAASLRGYTIYVPRSAFEDTKDDEFYWTDLVGMMVNNRAGECLGTVEKLLETGAHDVLVVQGEYGEKLIPFVSHYIDDVDEVARMITADWGVDY